MRMAASAAPVTIRAFLFRSLLTVVAVVFMCVGVGTVQSVSVQAKMQDKETCKALKSERAEFVGSGIRDDISKGPDWVKDNLPAEQVERIKRYLTLNGTIAFQCRGGGPSIKSRKKSAKKPSSRKKPSVQRAAARKKIVRKKKYKKKKKTSSVAFDPFTGN